MGFPFEMWTEEQEKELVRMINNGYSHDYCAKHLGRSELAILYRMDKLNLRRLSREEIERDGKKYIYNGLGRPCILSGKSMRPIAEMHKDLDAFEKKHGDTYREVFGENLLSPAEMGILLSRREKEKQEFFTEVYQLQFKVGDIVLVDQKKGPVVCEVVKCVQGNYLLRELVGNAKYCCSYLRIRGTSFPEKPKLYFDHSPMYGSVPCYVSGLVGGLLYICYHSPKTGVYKSRWVDINKIHSI